jgi:dTDP-4-dehydrorhamnose reductase
MKIVITGETGLLSVELQKLDPSIVSLPKKKYNISKKSIIKKLSQLNPDIIIHAGAVTDSNIVDKDPCLAIDTNVIGTAHISQYCIQYNKKLIFISTDYVYPGTVGNYQESDPLLPHNNYAWTKLAGECSVKLVTDYLIIRTSFGSSEFPYTQAWTNHIVSKDYVDIIAPMILKATKSNITGILNIGTNPKTMFEYAYKRNKEIKPLEKKSFTNFSLNTKKYEQLFPN